MTGYDVSCIVESKKHWNYFADVEREYAYVFGQQGKSPDGKNEFVLVNNYTELEQALLSGPPRDLGASLTDPSETGATFCGVPPSPHEGTPSP